MPRMRWILTILIAQMVLFGALPWLRKFGLGRLPGDINFRMFGRLICIPLTSTILIFIVAFLIARVI